MRLGLSELVIIAAVVASLASCLLPVGCALHAALRPESQWRAVAQSRTVWVLALIGLAFIPLVGLPGAAAYWFWLRPRLNAAP